MNISNTLTGFWRYLWTLDKQTKRIIKLDFAAFAESSDSSEQSEKNKAEPLSDKTIGKHAEKEKDKKPTSVSTSEKEKEPYSLRQKLGFILGVILFAIILIVPPPTSMYNMSSKIVLKSASEDLLQTGASRNVLKLNSNKRVKEISDTKNFLKWIKTENLKIYSEIAKKVNIMKACLAVAALMACWWIGETIPLAATSLLPIILFPLLGIANAANSCSPYANKVIFLFMGGFFIGEAMVRWNLHERIAMRITKIVGVSPKRIILGFMIATAFLSMWISNTATTVMMMPMALAIILHSAKVGQKMIDEGKLSGVDFSEGNYKFGTCLMLCIAYAASCGGIGTLIGTPPNIVFAGALPVLFPNAPTVDFFSWLMIGMPIAWTMVFLIWFGMTHFIYPPEIKEVPGGMELIDQQIKKMGPMNKGEKGVAIVLIIAATCWIFRSTKIIGTFTIPGLNMIFPWIDDSTIAIFASVLLFLWPINLKRGEFILNWEWATKIPWGILLLFGGGLALAGGVHSTGLDRWIGYQLVGLKNIPVLLIIFSAVTLGVWLSEMTSNTATTTTLMPILAAVALAIGQDPRLLMIPAAIACSCAFLLPVATPPNAIVFGTGYIKLPQMIKAGIFFEITGMFIVTLLSYLLIGIAFGVHAGIMPSWAMP